MWTVGSVLKSAGVAPLFDDDASAELFVGDRVSEVDHQFGDAARLVVRRADEEHGGVPRQQQKARRRSSSSAP